jgi:hypothetical protein
VIADAEVIARADGVSLAFETGWCMHHTSGEVTVEATRAAARTWRRRPSEHGYTVERRAHGLRATITYFDHNESESSGGVDGLDEALFDAFSRAVDRCLDDAR